MEDTSSKRLSDLGLRTHLEFLKKLVVKTNSNVLIVSYRGNPNGAGISEESVKEDAEAILAYVFGLEEIDKERVHLFGRGLGGAVAIHLAAHDRFKSKVKGVILENTFASIDDMLLDKLGRLGYIAKLFSANCWDSRGSIVSIECPILFIKCTSSK
jgi:pimeloyl-ACP methyl ester carboxylesterase